MEYQIDDKQLDASVFLLLVNQVWPNDYDVKQTEKALAAFASLQMDISSARSPSCSSFLRIRSEDPLTLAKLVSLVCSCYCRKQQRSVRSLALA